MGNVINKFQSGKKPVHIIQPLYNVNTVKLFYVQYLRTLNYVILASDDIGGLIDTGCHLSQKKAHSER